VRAFPGRRRVSIVPFASVTVTASDAESWWVSEIGNEHVPAPCGVIVNVPPDGPEIVATFAHVPAVAVKAPE